MREVLRHENYHNRRALPISQRKQKKWMKSMRQQTPNKNKRIKLGLRWQKTFR